MAEGISGTVPIKADPFEAAVETVRKALSLGKARKSASAPIYFGALRNEGRSRHNGIDLFVPVGTQIQLPSSKAVLIGMCRESSSGAGASIGNGLVFFVPNDNAPYFLLLAHLSKTTFKHLQHKGILIGSEVIAEPEGSVIAYSGASKAGPSPHVHVSVTTTFKFGGKNYRSEDFLEMYRNRTIPPKNFYATMPEKRSNDPKSLVGYRDPLAMIDSGKMRFSSLPEAVGIAKAEQKKQPIAIALR